MTNRKVGSNPIHRARISGKAFGEHAGSTRDEITAVVRRSIAFPEGGAIKPIGSRVSLGRIKFIRPGHARTETNFPVPNHQSCAGAAGGCVKGICRAGNNRRPDGANQTFQTRAVIADGQKPVIDPGDAVEVPGGVAGLPGPVRAVVAGGDKPAFTDRNENVGRRPVSDPAQPVVERSGLSLPLVAVGTGVNGGVVANGDQQGGRGSYTFEPVEGVQTDKAKII